MEYKKGKFFFIIKPVHAFHHPATKGKLISILGDRLSAIEMHAFSRAVAIQAAQTVVFLDDGGTPPENFIAAAAIITVIAGYYATAERKSGSLESASTDTLGNGFLKCFKLWSAIVPLQKQKPHSFVRI